MNDIYFDRNYGKLYEKIENGKVVIYKLKTSNGIITNQFIKREIPMKLIIINIMTLLHHMDMVVLLLKN